ncbi:hypothetical protein [Mesorhizobium sp. M7A.F.Ca.MR.362.00.0.0]|uniref:hypothetical protein n=1 Tax=Mesorhizobium sp. M7A.F.Ca.MR.362.00.0.0 TaxID=2496779 RepID=UPI000FD5BA3E|nr:hypothetical protein [Mesorhizobium sp. M7A.F.Ca.MR.362.00.0.0]RUU81294.1 hypothetical protein EOC06_08800 [Mesorhizobium sp. M7A.F.Ca.MR.362.00.0.0]
MGAVFAWLAARGLSTIAVYGIVALLAGGGVWAWSAHKYNQGYAAGETHERTAWQKQRDIDIAAREAERKATQAEIDRLAAELQLDAQKRKDEQADDDLKTALAATPGRKQICLPRKVARALDRAGR